VANGRREETNLPAEETGAKAILEFWSFLRLLRRLAPFILLWSAREMLRKDDCSEKNLHLILDQLY
jgi:hypothetical protein